MVMPVIRISDATMERLKAWAVPLEDTAESALAKALDAAENAQLPGREGDGKHSTSIAKTTRAVYRRAAPPDRLPQKEFRQPLLEVLYELGGSERVADLRPILKEKIGTTLLPGDLEQVATGEERWWNATCWERSNLVREGYLRDDSPRGTWELSERGMEHVTQSVAASPESFVEHLLAIPDVGDDTDFERDRSGPRRIDL